MNELKTISEVCDMLGITSRTVRYYEQCGLICTERISKNAPRRLDAENIERLRKIRFLKQLGLSLEDIAAVIDSETQAAQLIFERSSELKAQVREMIERIGLLEEVMLAAEQGRNIYNALQEPEPAEDPEKLKEIAAACAHLIRECRIEELKTHLCADMRMHPAEFFSAAWEMHIKPCGNFISFGEQTVSGNTVYTVLHYEKLDVRIKTDILHGIVCGLLFQHSPHTKKD